MAMDVKENFEDNTVTITSEKFQNELIISKDPKHPALFKLSWKTGAQPEAFENRFTNKPDAIFFAKNYVDMMKMSQSAKNEMLAERRKKNTSGKKPKTDNEV